MSWLDAILERSTEARRPTPLPAPARSAPAIHALASKPDIKSVFVETRRPYGHGDTGAGRWIFYSVEDGVLTIRDENGRPGKTHVLKDGDDPRHMAHRIGRSSLIDDDPIGFNRPLNLPPLSIA